MDLLLSFDFQQPLMSRSVILDNDDGCFSPPPSIKSEEDNVRNVMQFFECDNKSCSTATSRTLKSMGSIGNIENHGKFNCSSQLLSSGNHPNYSDKFSHSPKAESTPDIGSNQHEKRNKMKATRSNVYSRKNNILQKTKTSETQQNNEKVSADVIKANLIQSKDCNSYDSNKDISLYSSLLKVIADNLIIVLQTVRDLESKGMLNTSSEMFQSQKYIDALTKYKRVKLYAFTLCYSIMASTILPRKSLLVKPLCETLIKTANDYKISIAHAKSICNQLIEWTEAKQNTLHKEIETFLHSDVSRSTTVKQVSGNPFLGQTIGIQPRITEFHSHNGNITFSAESSDKNIEIRTIENNVLAKPLIDTTKAVRNNSSIQNMINMIQRQPTNNISDVIPPSLPIQTPNKIPVYNNSVPQSFPVQVYSGPSYNLIQKPPPTYPDHISTQSQNCHFPHPTMQPSCSSVLQSQPNRLLQFSKDDNSQFYNQLSGHLNQGGCVQSPTIDARERSISRDSGFMSPVNEHLRDVNYHHQSEQYGLGLGAISQESSLSSNVLKPPYGNCILCGRITELKCDGCHSVFYCSPDCQTFHWDTHKLVCKWPTQNN